MGSNFFSVDAPLLFMTPHFYLTLFSHIESLFQTTEPRSELPRGCVSQARRECASWKRLHPFQVRRGIPPLR